MSYANIPILGMTAHIVEDVMEKCYKSGMNDCISKPFQIEYLTKKIDSLSQRKIEVDHNNEFNKNEKYVHCLLYTSPSPRDTALSRMPSSA